jgi:hypothetical protein
MEDDEQAEALKSEPVKEAFKLLDSNSDSLVNEADVMPILEKLDSNKDGTVGEAELESGTDEIIYDLVYEEALVNPEAWKNKEKGVKGSFYEVINKNSGEGITKE